MDMLATLLWLLFGNILYQIIMFYSLNLRNVLCQIYLNKAEKKFKKKHWKLWEGKISPLPCGGYKGEPFLCSLGPDGRMMEVWNGYSPFLPQG